MRMLPVREIIRVALRSCRPGKPPEEWEFPEVVRRGCNRSFGPCEPEASCTGAKWGCTGAKEGLGGAKDSWETFAPWAQKSQKDLLHPPLTTFGDFPLLGNFPGPQHPKGCAPRVSLQRSKLGLSPSTVGSPGWFQEWLRIKAHRFSQSLFQPYSETP